MPIKPENVVLYPPKKEWLAIRAEILERDGHACKTCRIKNGAYIIRSADRKFYADGECDVFDAETGKYLENERWEDHEWNEKATKIVLTIAHLDHNPANNGEPGNRPNLAALCQWHHLRHDSEHHQTNAAETRSKTRIAKLGNGELFQ